MTSTTPIIDLDKDSGNEFLERLEGIAQKDVAGLKKAAESYGPSWKQRGGVGAFMMLARKWDRMEQRLKKLGGRVYDIFHGIATDDRGEGLIDDVRDLRRYLLLVEGEMEARGFQGKAQRDNAEASKELKQYPFTTQLIRVAGTFQMVVNTGRPGRNLALGVTTDQNQEPAYNFRVLFEVRDDMRQEAIDQLRLMADHLEKGH
jgi:hypothetical protein